MAEKKKRRAPPKPPPPHPDVGKQVWVKCRGSRPCGGNTAKIAIVFKLKTGGKSIRYRCTDCNGVFHITL